MRSLVVLLGLLICATAQARDFRDPTRPYQPPAPVRVAVAKSFVVNAIFVSSRRQIAVINGQRVAVGDVVDGATVTRIEKHAITLDAGGREVTATLKRSR